MKLSFVKFDPTHNMTIIVTDPVPRSEHASVAASLMDYSSVYAEQVGFVEKPSDPRAMLRLQMMGGEFCGNAAMCAAVLAARDRGISEGDIPVEISGAEGVMTCSVAKNDDAYTCTVNMPLPVSAADTEICPVIRLPGITHGIYECPDPAALRKEAPALLRKLADAEPGDAVGLILFSKEKQSILPLVYVRGTDSMVWENGCGSGSAAVGAYMALKYAIPETSVTQPGGTITARCTAQNGIVQTLSITGRVKISAEGIAYI